MDDTGDVDGNVAASRGRLAPWIVLASMAAAVSALAFALVRWDRILRRETATKGDAALAMARTDAVVASPRFFERRWNATSADGFRVVVIDDFATRTECEAAVRVANVQFMRVARVRRAARMDARRPLDRVLLRRAANVAESEGRLVDRRAAWVRVATAPFVVTADAAWCMILCCDDHVEELAVEPCGMRLPGRRSRCFWFYWTPDHATSAVVRVMPADVDSKGDARRHAIVALLSR